MYALKSALNSFFHRFRPFSRIGAFSGFGSFLDLGSFQESGPHWVCALFGDLQVLGICSLLDLKPTVRIPPLLLLPVNLLHSIAPFPPCRHSGGTLIPSLEMPFLPSPLLPSFTPAACGHNYVATLIPFAPFPPLPPFCSLCSLGPFAHAGVEMLNPFAPSLPSP